MCENFQQHDLIKFPENIFALITHVKSQNMFLAAAGGGRMSNALSLQGINANDTKVHLSKIFYPKNFPPAFREEVSSNNMV